MKAGDVAIWHPTVLSGVPRRVEILSIGETFAQVSVPRGEPNPNGSRSYTARLEELHSPGLWAA